MRSSLGRRRFLGAAALAFGAVCAAPKIGLPHDHPPGPDLAPPRPSYLVIRGKRFEIDSFEAGRGIWIVPEPDADPSFVVLHRCNPSFFIQENGTTIFV